MRYFEALFIWNVERGAWNRSDKKGYPIPATHKYMNPRRGTPEHAEVMEVLRRENKREGKVSEKEKVIAAERVERERLRGRIAANKEWQATDTYKSIHARQRAEMAALQERHAAEAQVLKLEHQIELDRIKARYRTDGADLKKRHRDEEKELELRQWREIKQLREQHDAEKARDTVGGWRRR